jgi:hypothetical protein
MPHHHETKVHTRIIPDHAEVVWNVSYPQGSTKTGKIVGFLPIQNVYIVKHDRVSFSYVRSQNVVAYFLP